MPALARIFLNSRVFFPMNENCFEYPFRMLTAMLERSSLVYLPKSIVASNRRMKALSNLEYRFVVANSMICSDSSSI